MKPRFLMGKSALPLAVALALTLGRSARAANAYYNPTSTSGNWSAATWTMGGGGGHGATAPNSTDAGNIVYFTNSTATTLTLDQNITVGVLADSSQPGGTTVGHGMSMTLNSDGTHSITMDGTGLTTIELGSSLAGAFVSGEAAINANQNNSGVVLTVNPNIVMLNTNLGIGIGINAPTVTIGGNITNGDSVTRQLNFRSDGSGGTVTVNGSIGVTQTGTGGITIQNLSSSSGAVTLAGNVGGASGTGAAITILNTSTGTGIFKISGNLGASVSGITQNSATSTMVLTGANSAFTGTLTVTAGALQATDGTGLSGSDFFSLNGGVLQGNGTSSFTRSLGTTGDTFSLNGGGFSANGGVFTVDIGGGTALQWGSTVGTNIVGTLQFGSSTANNETLFQNAIDLNAATRTVNVTAGTGGDSNVMSGIISTSSGTAGLTKTGTGVLTLTGANTYNGTTTVSAGALQAADGTGLPATSLLALDGGVFQGNGTASFTRGLGTAAGTVEFTANGGGFSANGGVLTVNIGGGSALQWGTTVGSQIVGTLQFGSVNANNETLFQNAIDLNGATRTVNVTAGAGGDSNVISGIIGNSTGTAGLTAGSGGTGTLTLTGANTYNGATTIASGVLAFTNAANGGLASSLGESGNAGGNLVFSATGTTLRYTGGGGSTDRLFSFNYNTNATGNGIYLDASGTGAISFTNTGAVSSYGTASQARTLYLTGSNTGNNTFSITYGNNGSTADSLYKSGVGTWVVNGSNTFTGGVTVTSQGSASAGKLILSSSNAWGSSPGTVTLGGGTNNANDQGNLVLALGSALTGTPNVNLSHGNSGTYTDSITFDAPSSGTTGYTQNFGTLTASQKTILDVTQTPNITGQSVAAFGNFTMSGAGNNAAGGNTFVPSNGAAMTFGNLTNGTAGYTTTLTLDGTSTGNAITGAIANNATTGLTAITKQNTSIWTLKGPSTYTGATAVNGGTLTLGNGGNLGATAVTVGSGTLAVTQNASSTSNTLAGTLTLNSGSAFTMTDGYTSTFNVTGATTLAPATGTSPTLTFDIGGTTTATDLLNITGAATVGAAKAVINVNGIGSTALTTGTYTIIQAASGLNTNFVLGTVNVAAGGNVYNLTLGGSATAETITVAAGAANATTAYWTGSQGNASWATQNGTTFNTNFGATASGSGNTLALPVSSTNVTLSAASASYLNTTLDQSFTINSLTFSGTGTSNTAGSSIATGSGTNTLTINAGALNGNTLGNGITVAAGSGVDTISANVALGASQTWTNNATNALVVSGNVSGTGYSLTKAGTGALTLSGTNSYTGGTILSAGSLNLNSGAALGTGTFTLSGGAFDNTNSGFTTGLSNNNAQVWSNGASVAFTGTNALNLGTGAVALGADATTNSFTLTNYSALAGTSLTVGGAVTSGTGGTAGAKTLNIAGAGSTALTGNITKGTATSLTITDTSTGTLTLSGISTITTLNMNASGGVVDIGAGQLTFSDAGASFIQSTAGGTINATGGGTIVLGSMGSAAPNFGDNGTASGTVLTINAKITGGYGFEVYNSATSTGTVVLTAANTFTGDVNVDGGTLSVSSVGNAGSTTSNLGAGTNIYLSNNVGTLKYTGTGETSNRVIQLNGTTTGGVIDQSGTGNLDFTANFGTPGAGAKTLTLQGSTAGTGEIAGIIPDNSTTNKTSVTKAGTGLWILAGANTYTGATTVSNGTLLVNGSTAAGSAVAVNGGVLGGSGNVNGAVTIGASGTINPGTVGMAGTLNTGATTISGTFACDISGANSDKLVVTGNLNISAATLAISGTPTASSYTIATYTGTLTGSTFAIISPALPSGYSLKVDTTNKQILLQRSGYSSWIAGFTGYTGNTTPGYIGADGVAKLMKYVLNGSPLVPSQSLMPTQAEDGNGNLVFTYYRLDESTGDTTQLFEYSTDLVNWTDVTIPTATSGIVTVNNQGAGVDKVVVTLPTNADTQLFGRLKVTQP